MLIRRFPVNGSKILTADMGVNRDGSLLRAHYVNSSLCSE